MPTFSIIQPAHNYARYLDQAMSSLLAQRFEDFELIVIDDASTDTTWEVIESFDDPRIRAVRHEVNRGLCATLNHGLELATGDFIAVVNADDRCRPDFLQRIHDGFTGHPEVAAVGTYITAIDAASELIPGDPAGAYCNHDFDFEDPATWLWQNRFPGCAGVRRSVVDEVGGFAADLVAVNDWDLWVRLFIAGHRFLVIPEIEFEWRMHGENITARDPRDLLGGYSLMSQRHLHPYLQQIGRPDLIASNVAGFLNHPAFTDLDVDFVTDITERILLPLELPAATAVMQRLAATLADHRAASQADAASLAAAAQESVALREELLTTQASVREREEALRTTQVDLQATLDRLAASERDRRAVTDVLQSIQSTLPYRVARKVKHAVARGQR